MSAGKGAFEMKYRDIPIQERMRVSFCLAFVGGFLETYTYRLQDGVFANAQTGNLVLLALSLMENNGKWVYYFCSICAFIAGVCLSESLCAKLSGSSRLNWLSTLLIFEIFLLGAIPLFPQSTPIALLNIIVSFVCSLQYHGFPRTHGMALSTTMCTANLRNASQNMFQAIREKDLQKAKASSKYFLVILYFIFGATISYLTIDVFGEYAIWTCCGMLLIVYILLQTEKMRIKKNPRV